MRTSWSYWLASLALGISISWQAMAETKTKVTVFAAASLTNAIKEIATAYEREQGVQIVTSFASSSTLARQIEQGAPADLFISADQQWMNYAIEKGTIDSSRRYTLRANTLVLVAAPGSNNKSVVINQQTDWQRLLDGQRLAVGDPDHVPAGIYARQALEYLGSWPTIVPLLAPANVERGEAPYGIVYASDALISNKVTVVGHLPIQSHEAIEYPMAVVKDHDNTAVLAFWKYLKQHEAARVFKNYGFLPIHDTK